MRPFAVLAGFLVLGAAAPVGRAFVAGGAADRVLARVGARLAARPAVRASGTRRGRGRGRGAADAR